MAAAHTAQVLLEGKATVVHFEGESSLPLGPVLVQENGLDGGVTLVPILAEDEPNPWIEFFDYCLSLPRDEHWHEFSRIMDERPMNQPPVDRKLFADEVG